MTGKRALSNQRREAAMAMSKKAWIRLVVASVGTVLVLILILQNRDPAKVSFFFWRGEMSVSILLVVTFLLGILAGIFMSLYVNARRK